MTTSPQRQPSPETSIPTREDIGARIRQGRQENRLNQYDMAQLLNTRLPDGNWSNSKVSKIENGDLGVDADVLAIIADVQGMPIEFYFIPVGKLSEVGRMGVRNPRSVNSDRLAPVIPIEQGRKAHRQKALAGRTN